MPRKNNSNMRREQLIPVIASAFAELGFRRATTAELARRCEVQENILYRLWPDKKKMFLAAIDYVYMKTFMTWEGLKGGEEAGKTAAERILEYEAGHHGEYGLYRIVFAGLSETDDPEVLDALKKMYTRFHGFISLNIAAHRKKRCARTGLPGAELSAWALVGLGTVANISRELGRLPGRKRKRLINEVGKLLLNGGED